MPTPTKGGARSAHAASCHQASERRVEAQCPNGYSLDSRSFQCCSSTQRPSLPHSRGLPQCFKGAHMLPSGNLTWPWRIIHMQMIYPSIKHYNFPYYPVAISEFWQMDFRLFQALPGVQFLLFFAKEIPKVERLATYRCSTGTVSRCVSIAAGEDQGLDAA